MKNIFLKICISKSNLIFILGITVFLSFLSSCVIKPKIQITLKNPTKVLNVSVANVQVINHQFIITGSGLSGVTTFKIKNGASTTELQIESKSNTSIVANTLSNVSFAVGTIFDFVLSNANAASTFQVTFTNTNNSITALMLTSMGATKGQIMKYNGTSWVASSITNAQTYLGTWNATTNNPDLTLPSSTPGDYYIVSVAGTFNSIVYAIGDWIISDGYNWQKVANSAVVVSTFNGRRGIVTLVPGDYVSLKNGSGKLTGSSLNDLADLNIVTPLNGSVLKYDIATSKWIVGVDNAGAGAFTGAFSKAVATDGAGALTTSTTTATELNFVSGVTSSIQTQLGLKLSSTLADGKIFVGNGSAVATGVSLSGDATLINTGAITLKNTGTAGTYTTVTTDAQGRVTSGTNPAIAAITALTGDVTASGTGSVAATIAIGAVTSSKIFDGTILPSDLDFTGTNIGTSGLVIRNMTGGFSPLVCATVGYVPTWTVTGFICQAITAGSLSGITAALGTNTINNLNFAQVWNWATATTESLMTMTANALSTGTILNLTTSSASLNSTNGLLNVANTGASVTGVLARFQSNSTAGSGVTILNSGNVGIGTTSPSAPFSVAMSSSVVPLVPIQNYSVSDGNGSGRVDTIEFLGGAYWNRGMQIVASETGGAYATKQSLMFSLNQMVLSNEGAYPINFFTNNTQRMVVDGGGNVGVGTTTPAAPLDVNGDVKVGNSSATCSATTKGSIRYNNASSVLEFCNGTSWNLIQAAGCSDATPNNFIFADQANVTISTLTTSDVIQITGINCRVPVSISGLGSPAYRTCSDSGCSSVLQDWTTGSASIGTGEYIQIRQTSDAAGGATDQITVIAGTAASVWSVSTAGGDCTASPAVGTICADGTVYAGLSPDGAVKMYTTRCDFGQTWNGSSCTGIKLLQNWNNGTANWVSAGFTNTNTGKTNTTGLNASVDIGSPYAAAKSCEDLSQDTHSDWYLPAINELNVLYLNRSAIRNFDSALYYWSSSEGTTNSGYAARYSDGFLDGFIYKNSSRLVRCVRR